MSCKKELSLQLTHLFIKALFLIFIFSSCAKEEFYLPENPQPIPDQNPIIEIGDPYFLLEKNKQEPNSNAELQNVLSVLTMEKHIRELTLNTFYASYFYPQLRGLTGSTAADTRTGCPCSTLSTSGGMSTMTLNYDNCATISGATYDGIITVVITGELEDDGTMVDITLSDNFTVDDGDIDGSLSMIYDSGTMRYNITYLCISNTTNGTDITKVAIGAGGFGGQIGVDVVTPNSDPTGLLDDNFIYEAGMLEVTCPDNGTGEPVVLNAEITTEIIYNIPCGVPQVGQVQLNKMDDGSPYGEIHFDYTNDPTLDCDNAVAVYLASNTSGVPEIFMIE